MAAPLVPDALWSLIRPLLPAAMPKPQGGRPRVSDRACLTGILFVLRSGIPWRMLPKQLGCGSGMTCWRRLRDWQYAGIWDLTHFVLLNWLARDGQIDWLAIELTGANCHDSTQALPLLDAIPPLQGPRGRPRCHPDCILGDRAYDAERIRRALRARHISPLLAMRNTENGSGLGRWRWGIERTFAWLNQFRRLRLRYEKRADMHKAFLSLSCALICWKFLHGHVP